jgi:hypothetical protein
MKTKDETVKFIEKFYLELKSMHFDLGVLKSDNGGEFVNAKVQEFASGNFVLTSTYSRG